MPIMPVTFVNFNKNLNNNVSFEGKINKNQENQSSSHGMSMPLRSIPVIALIAMSPINASSLNSDGNKVVESNAIELVEAPQQSKQTDQMAKFNEGTMVGEYVFKNLEGAAVGRTKLILQDRDGDKNTIERMYHVWATGTSPFRDNRLRQITALNSFNYTVLGEDGLLSVEFRFYDISTTGNLGDLDENRNVKDDYIKEIQPAEAVRIGEVIANKTSKVKYNSYKHVIRPSSDFTLQNDSKGNVIANAPAVVTSADAKYMKSEVNFENGTTIRIYEKNGERFATYCKRGVVPELKLDAVATCQATFQRCGPDPTVYTYVQANLKDANNKTYSIIPGIGGNLLQPNNIGNNDFSGTYKLAKETIKHDYNVSREGVIEPLESTGGSNILDLFISIGKMNS